ncbi:MAG: hypothetical protein HFG34_03555 [Eubacterium sp.]|nr:hypothetical protein [Eubacterium sp.]
MLKEYSGIRISGLRSRRADREKRSADVAAELAEELLLSRHAVKEDIKVLIYVTQSPLFMTPSTSFYIAKKLQIGQDCFQYDINQGAGGMLIGIQLAASLMLSLEGAEKGLLLMADDELKYDTGEQTAASVLLLEKSKEKDSRIYVKNASFGNSFTYYYQGYGDKSVHMDERFLSTGGKLLEKKIEEISAQCLNRGITPEHRICSPQNDSAVRLPIYLEEKQITGCSLLAALGAGLSVTTLICDLKKDIYII